MSILYDSDDDLETCELCESEVESLEYCEDCQLELCWSCFEKPCREHQAAE